MNKTVARPQSADSGIALVSVLMVISVLLVLGVGTSALTQSNLLTAENLAANAVAKANAEAGIDTTVVWLREQFLKDGTVLSSLEAAPTGVAEKGPLDYALAPAGGYVVNGDGTVTLRIVGHGPRQAEHQSEALVAFADGGGSGGGSPFHGAVVGCEAVTVKGSGRIDSFDSRLGTYASQKPGVVGHVRTTEPGATVTVTGASPIYGDVNSTGSVYASGSARVIGNINASGAVDLTSAATYEGDVRTTGNVRVTNSANIYGSVSSNADVTFTNVSTVQRDVYAGGSIKFTNGGKVHGDAVAGGGVEGVRWTENVLGATRQRAGPVNNQPVPAEECDPVGVAAVIDGFEKVPTSPAISIGGVDRWEVRPSGVQQLSGKGGAKSLPNYKAHEVELFGERVSLIRVPKVSVGGSGSLRVAGGHVVLLVDEDFIYSGGGDGLVIEEGSTLTILVKGKVDFGSSQASKTAGGIPPIHVFSSYQNRGDNPWNAGVKVSGAGRLDATIYAPFSDVGVTGSGELHGSVRGRTVSVTGRGDIHFDVALAEANLGTEGTAQAGERSAKVVSRR